MEENKSVTAVTEAHRPKDKRKNDVTRKRGGKSPRIKRGNWTRNSTVNEEEDGSKLQEGQHGTREGGGH